MKDFARLAVGILLLGLAIFLSLNFEEQPGAQANQEDPINQEESNPDWQAPDTTEAKVASTRNDDFVRPKFDTARSVFARPLREATELEASLQQPPRIADRYEPAKPLVVTGQFQQTSNLVPVQPKPSFTGTITVVRKIHVIRHGDSLQSISREYYGDASRYLDVYKLNKDVLAGIDQLPVGVEIRIPGH